MQGMEASKIGLKQAESGGGRLPNLEGAEGKLSFGVESRRRRWGPFKSNRTCQAEKECPARHWIQ